MVLERGNGSGKTRRDESAAVSRAASFDVGERTMVTVLRLGRPTKGCGTLNGASIATGEKTEERTSASLVELEDASNSPTRLLPAQTLHLHRTIHPRSNMLI